MTLFPHHVVFLVIQEAAPHPGTANDRLQAFLWIAPWGAHLGGLPEMASPDVVSMKRGTFNTHVWSIVNPETEEEIMRNSVLVEVVGG